MHRRVGHQDGVTTTGSDPDRLGFARTGADAAEVYSQREVIFVEGDIGNRIDGGWLIGRFDNGACGTQPDPDCTIGDGSNCASAGTGDVNGDGASNAHGGI